MLGCLSMPLLQAINVQNFRISTVVMYGLLDSFDYRETLNIAGIKI